MPNDDWQKFLSLCLKMKNTDELNQFLNFFLTIDEKENIIDRFLLTKALLSGKHTQREISANLHISIAKITRGSNFLKTLNPETKAFLTEMLSD